MMAFLRVKASPFDKSFWCRIFGHNVSGYRNRAPYLYKGGWAAIDGIECRHVSLIATCDSCGEKITVAMIHEHAEDSKINGDNT